MCCGSHFDIERGVAGRDCHRALAANTNFQRSVLALLWRLSRVQIALAVKNTDRYARNMEKRPTSGIDMSSKQAVFNAREIYG